MPKLRPGQVPSLRRHKPSGRALVTLSAKDRYLGPWPDGSKPPPADVVQLYHRLVAEWLAGDRDQGPPPNPGGQAGQAPGVTIGELILRFWRHAEGHYRRPDGTLTSEPNHYRLALRPLRRLYEPLPAAGTGSSRSGPRPNRCWPPGYPSRA